MQTFGWPGTRIAEYEHWAVLLRPKQATLGALVLVNTSGATRYSDIAAAAHAEMARVVDDIETALAAAFTYDKINYLMLMMVDPHVHYHVLPRYAEAREFAGIEFTDPGWPAVPDLGHDNPMPADDRAALMKRIAENWPQAAG
jgi:diadenosine tetraphosphate (Ap4A) HIT family hydrolase